MNREALINIISFFLALLFFYAAVSKGLDVQKFQVQLGQSTMLTLFAVPLSYIVPAVEATLAVLLFIPSLRLTAYYIYFSVMVVFTTYIIVIMNYSYHVPCSCGGILQTLGWKEHLIFNAFIVFASLTGILMLESFKQRVGTQLPNPL
jgi:hypothetical protein